MLEDLPAGYKIVDFSAAHFFLLNLNKFQKAGIDAFPGYLDWLAEVSILGPSFTALFEGKPIFVAGICPIIPGTYEGWMLADISLPSHGIAFARRARTYYDQISDHLPIRRLQFSVNAQDIASIRFARWLRFEPEGTLRSFSCDGSDVLMMSRIY